MRHEQSSARARQGPISHQRAACHARSAVHEVEPARAQGVLAALEAFGDVVSLDGELHVRPGVPTSAPPPMPFMPMPTTVAAAAAALTAADLLRASAQWFDGPSAAQPQQWACQPPPGIPMRPHSGFGAGRDAGALGRPREPGTQQR